jgi:LacI family transcriptional regulator
MQEVAHAAGVSSMTVSRALRNSPLVRPERRKAICKLAAEMGYKPNLALSEIMSEIGRGRAGQGRGAIAWLNYRFQSDFWKRHVFSAPFRKGAVARCAELGYSLDEFWVRPDDPAKPNYARILRARGIHGVILLPNDFGKCEPRIDLSGFAVATTAHRLPFHSVSDDAQSNMECIWEELMLRGYSRPMHLVEALQLDIPSDALSGTFQYFTRLLRTRDRIPPVVIPQGLDLAQRGAFAAEKIRRLKPDVIIGLSNHLIEWCNAAGLSVPEDVGIVHTNVQQDVADWSGITSDMVQKGREIVNLVTAQLFHNEHGEPEVKRHVQIRGLWNPGQTLRALPAKAKRSRRQPDAQIV